jgi:hypothetical protein
MLLYCDWCGTKHGYDITPNKKSKGECGLCHKRLGPMNEMTDADVEVLVNNISQEVFIAGGFKVQQVKSIPVGTIVTEIYPGLQHKIIGHDTVAFFGGKKLCVYHPSTGKRIEITF